jgi:hypothetical protein
VGCPGAPTIDSGQNPGLGARARSDPRPSPALCGDARATRRKAPFTCLSRGQPVAYVSPPFSVCGLDDRKSAIHRVGEGDSTVRRPEVEAVVEESRVVPGLKL